MSTRSVIIRKTRRGYEGVYCHSDGYPEYNGFCLANFYKSAARVKELISLGDLSSINKRVETKKPHSFNNRAKGVVVAYHRDRGEKKHMVSGTIKDILSAYGGIEYVYIFEKGKWSAFDDDMRPVAIPETSRYF